MQDQENGAVDEAAGAEAAPQVKMNVLTQFVRDLSFENVLAQRGVGGEVTPDITINVNLDAKKRKPEHQFEVTINLKVESKNKADAATLFVLEMEYTGVFHVEGVPEDQIHPFLLIECPRMLFPFLRRIVHDVTRDGGFPALNMENIDFMQIYRQEIMRRQAETAPKNVS
ncbi:protein-export chaperone SecB [Pseudohalocynthiibacter aestuariivivens]|uniref:Protein-export protein SecB n=1 Tax=Roseovarius pelagicus TaxID=2980108 RepID=A0ABY6DDH6_9RHOB|nr:MULTISPECIES: protein-export chaperone SecB [Rhodobacterales]QIE46162.1 protein-export chaperone SecB [Pseudohalocynthiibacter aestuariivivens]UXX81875.1 protein-export chaperone SecB [Roseovarius pelagicus]